MASFTAPLDHLPRASWPIAAALAEQQALEGEGNLGAADNALVYIMHVTHTPAPTRTLIVEGKSPDDCLACLVQPYTIDAAKRVQFTSPYWLEDMKTRVLRSNECTAQLRQIVARMKTDSALSDVVSVEQSTTEDEDT